MTTEGAGLRDVLQSILIVDDDVDLSRALCVRLRAAGFDVFVASNADQASRIAIHEHPDLILLDINMPHYTGTEFHECLKFARAGHHIPIVYLSGNDSLSNRQIAQQLGAKAFVCKPYDPAFLLTTIHSVLEQASQATARPSSATPSASNDARGHT